MYQAMERFLEQEPALRIVLSRDRKLAAIIPSDDEISTIEAVVRALKPVSTLTDMLSGWSPISGLTLVVAVATRFRSRSTGGSPHVPLCLQLYLWSLQVKPV